MANTGAKPEDRVAKAEAKRERRSRQDAEDLIETIRTSEYAEGPFADAFLRAANEREETLRKSA